MATWSIGAVQVTGATDIGAVQSAAEVGAEVKLLAGTVDAQSVVSGDMKSEESLQGTVDAQSTVAGNVNSEEVLQGSIDAQSGAAGNLELVVPTAGHPYYYREIANRRIA